MIKNMQNMDILIDIFWVMHIFKTFCTPYIKDVDVKDKFVDIAKRYLFGYFLFDVGTTAISLYIDPSYNEDGSIDPEQARLNIELYALKLFRLVYINHSFSIVKRIFDSVINLFNVRKQTRNTLNQIILLLYFLLFLMHWIACFWIYYGETEGDNSWKLYSGQMSIEQ
jgi:hypothetical protein